MARISCATGKGHAGGPATHQVTSAEQKYTDVELMALLAHNFIFYCPYPEDEPYKFVLREQPLGLNRKPLGNLEGKLDARQIESVKNWIPEYLKIRAYSVYDEKTGKQVNVQDVLDRLGIKSNG